MLKEFDKMWSINRDDCYRTIQRSMNRRNSAIPSDLGWEELKDKRMPKSFYRELWQEYC